MYRSLQSLVVLLPALILSRQFHEYSKFTIKVDETLLKTTKDAPEKFLGKHIFHGNKVKTYMMLLSLK